MSDKEILTLFEEVNQALIKEFLCLPPYNSISNSFVTGAHNDIKSDKKITHLITAKVVLPFRRAYQMVYRYRELEIFDESILEVIEFSTLTFFEGNHLCSYLSLMPVVESLLRKWHLTDKSCEKDFPKSVNKDYISNKCKKLREALQDNHTHNWLKLNIEYLEKVITKVFCTDHSESLKKNEIDGNDIFNRNSALHKLTGVNGSNEKIILWIARIFLMIDVIAEVYLRSYDADLQNLGKYEKLLGPFDLDYNQNLFEIYFEFYKQAFSDGLTKSRNNFIRNILLKTRKSRS